MRVVPYIRVSTRDQLDAFGPDRQREAIKAWAALHGHRLAREVLEDVSGTVAPFERDGWNDAVARCAETKSVGVVVADLSRLSRDQVKLELTIQAMPESVALYSTAGEEQRVLDDPNDPQRKLIRTLLAAVNEYDRAMLNSRMQAGRRIKKSRGGYAGGQPPYGYTGSGKAMEITPNPKEWPTLELILTMRGKNLSTREIAAALNKEKKFNREGHPWASASIARIVKRAAATEGAVA